MGLGGGNNAAKVAQQQEDQRQAQIKSGVSAVNGVFDSPERKAQQQDFLKATRQQLVGDVNTQQVKAARNLKFGLAKSGLTGGSAAVDAGGQLNTDYQKGLLTAEQKAQGSFSDLLGADETARTNNIQLVQQGLDTGTAASRAASALQQNIQKSNSAPAQVGDVFGATANVWQKQQDAARERRGLLATTGGLYGRNGTSLWGGP